MATIAQAKAIGRLSPTCRHERLGLETTRSLLVAFPDTPKHRCLRDCLAMKMHTLRRLKFSYEIRLHRIANERALRVSFFGRKLISWTKANFLDATQDSGTGLVS